MTTTTVAVAARSLRAGDTFAYGFGEVRVSSATPLPGSNLVEVRVTDEDSTTRWLDYGVSEMVQVTGGPSYDRVTVASPAERVSATQRARQAVRAGKVRSLPTSAALVLYAVAAAQEEATDGYAPSIGSIATGAGLAVSTTQGYLRSLASKGLVRQSGMGWTVAP